MSDRVRLAATLFLPDGGGPSPVIVEANPYRKDDFTQSYWPEYRRLRDEGGFAVARIDLRGTGSSEGLATDEYPEQERDDLCEAIAWLAAQDWCSGSAGMYGYSYSGFNSIQVAMRRPPALKAIVPIYATDDRYTDDTMYYGGARRGLDFTDYPSYMVAQSMASYFGRSDPCRQYGPSRCSSSHRSSHGSNDSTRSRQRSRQPSPAKLGHGGRAFSATM